MLTCMLWSVGYPLSLRKMRKAMHARLGAWYAPHSGQATVGCGAKSMTDYGSSRSHPQNLSWTRATFHDPRMENNATQHSVTGHGIGLHNTRDQRGARTART